jgi:hypothetical protein
MGRQIFKKQTWACLFLVIAAVISGSAILDLA